MDADLISFESMLAAKAGANWAFWSMIAAVVSATATLFTLFIAGAALNTWRQQEKHKAKLELKAAMLELADAIEAMPESWSFIHINAAKAIIRRKQITSGYNEELVKMFYLRQDMGAAFSLVVKRWLMCEKILKNTKAEQVSKDFSSKYHDYARKGGNKAEVQSLLKSLISEIVIF